MYGSKVIYPYIILSNDFNCPDADKSDLMKSQRALEKITNDLAKLKVIIIFISNDITLY